MPDRRAAGVVVEHLRVGVPVAVHGEPGDGLVDEAGGGGFATSAAYLRQYFTSLRLAATVTSPYGIPTQDDGGKVCLCAGPRQPWGRLWPLLRHYD